MIIDILFAIVLLLAVFKGWKKGLIVGVFSLLALIAGAAAALKLSASFAIYMQKETGHPSPMWPVVTFILIFIVVAVLVHLIARLLEKTLQLAMLGWANRLCGILLYGVAYIILFSIGLWFANQLYLIPPTLKSQSHIYPWASKIAPEVIDHAGKLAPWFKDSFHQLEHFFQSISPLQK
jgi:membrane protein required for colicin V production